MRRGPIAPVVLTMGIHIGKSLKRAVGITSTGGLSLLTSKSTQEKIGTAVGVGAAVIGGGYALGLGGSSAAAADLSTTDLGVGVGGIGGIGGAGGAVATGTAAAATAGTGVSVLDRLQGFFNSNRQADLESQRINANVETARLNHPNAHSFDLFNTPSDQGPNSGSLHGGAYLQNGNTWIYALVIGAILIFVTAMFRRS